jgi:two-component system response regulator AtoC
MPDALATSELQGVRRGAFSGAVADRAGHAEQASGGTLFLDEIGDIGPGIQVALLRLLQEGEVTRLGESTPRKVDVRFLFATHRDLEHGIREGWFRQDLYYRVNVVSITIPPLRERPEDLPGLLRSVGGRVAARFGIPPPSFAPAAIAVLQAFPWPGNVRQLENVLQRTFVNLRGDEVRPADLPAELRTRREADAPEGLRPAVERFEREYVSGVLRRCGGNRSQAARVLGLSRQGLLGKLKSLGIQDELPPAPAGGKPRGKR